MLVKGVPVVQYMCQWTGSSLIQEITFCLLSAKSISELYWLIFNHTLWNKLQCNLNQINYFHSRKCISNVIFQKYQAFSWGLNSNGSKGLLKILESLVLCLWPCFLLNVFSCSGKTVFSCWNVLQGIFIQVMYALHKSICCSLYT